jgi:hypothetical protein
MEIRMRERALHAAIAREGDQSGLCLGVSIHDTAHWVRTNRTRDKPKGCTLGDESLDGIPWVQQLFSSYQPLIYGVV